jgi:hypothetical protein
MLTKIEDFTRFHLRRLLRIQVLIFFTFILRTNASLNACFYKWSSVLSCKKHWIQKFSARKILFNAQLIWWLCPFSQSFRVLFYPFSNLIYMTELKLLFFLRKCLLQAQSFRVEAQLTAWKKKAIHHLWNIILLELVLVTKKNIQSE